MNELKLTRRAVISALAGMVGGLTSGLCLAQDSTPIKIAIGFPPGGSGDLFARILADALREV